MKGLTLEESLHQYTRFLELLEKYLSDDPKRLKEIKEFFGNLELTLTSSPYSVKKGSVGAYPGGYIVTINKLIEASLILDKVWDKFSSEKKYTLSELVFSAVMCEIGKLGTSDQPFFIPNDNDWEIKNRGLLFKYNPYHYNMKYSDRAIYTLQSNFIPANENEFLAIKLYNSFFDEENNHYFKWDNRLPSNIAIILNQAYQIVNNTN
jgi:hypothetical protein